MADNTYDPLVYRKQGAIEFVVASGGAINIETGGKILTNGTQAVGIAQASSSTAAQDRLNELLTALKNVGMFAAT